MAWTVPGGSESDVVCSRPLNGDMVRGTSDAKRLTGLGLGDTVRSVVLDLSFDLRDATAEKGKQPVPSLNGRAQLQWDDGRGVEQDQTREGVP